MPDHQLVGAATTDRPQTAEVVAAAPSAVAAAVAGPSVLDAFDDLDMSPEDVAVPLLAINRKVGQDDSGIALDDGYALTAEFVWAARTTTRVHFPARYDENPGGRPDCYSTDGAKPDAQIAEPKAASCAGCAWSFEVTGGKAGPDGTPGCGKNLEALVYMETSGGVVRVARIRFGGIAYKPARNYWESFRFARPKMRAVQYITRMTLEAVKTDNGAFLSPAFSRGRQLSDDEAVTIALDAREMLGSFQALVADDIVDSASRDVESTAPGPFDGPGLEEKPPFADPATGEIGPAEQTQSHYSDEPF